MQNYNRRTSHILSARSAELQSIVGMLTGAMSQISTTSQTSIARLQDLQRQVEQAVMLEDVRTVKLRLSECLESMRGETERQRNESVKVVDELKKGLQDVQAPKRAEASAGTDPLTGLPSRAEGEAAILAAGGPGLHAYAALFVLSRVQAIATRYGSELGDGVLLVLLQRLSLGLSPQDHFFRWSPDSFLAVLHRKESGDLLRREVTRLLSVRLEQTFEIASRSVTLPISPTWTILPLFESSQGEVLRKLDLFSATGRA
jgi:GGDEF domain-containing protein